MVVVAETPDPLLQIDIQSDLDLLVAKNSKLQKLPEKCFELVGKGGWPPIST
jgi:hypothetical protein